MQDAVETRVAPEVTVTIDGSAPATGAPTIVQASVDCEQVNRLSCSWTATPPVLPGPYTASAWAGGRPRRQREPPGRPPMSVPAL